MVRARTGVSAAIAIVACLALALQPSISFNHEHNQYEVNLATNFIPEQYVNPIDKAGSAVVDTLNSVDPMVANQIILLSVVSFFLFGLWGFSAWATYAYVYVPHQKAF